VSDAFAAAVTARRNTGAPLPKALGADYQRRIGSPLGDVRLDTDAESDHSRS
jgi:hypothetical protein